jgi:BirA family transcriptional regulator, biotin operon repressor / biotin---[acetyl-CoA-carboxylase] ligase
MLVNIKNIKRFRHIDSTFSAARNWMESMHPKAGSVVLADYQTNGKGSGSNSWQSERGKNILLSMILYPDFLDADKQFHLNKVFSLALLATVKHFLSDEDIVVKWPNDLLVQKKKIAGLLFQNTIVSGKILQCIAGIGLNVNQIGFPDFFPSACSLASIAGNQFNRETVLEILLQHIEFYYNMLCSGGTEKIHDGYMSNLLNYEKQARYKSDGEFFTGTIKDITQFGQLEMMVNGRRKIFDMKEIEFIIH